MSARKAKGGRKAALTSPITASDDDDASSAGSAASSTEGRRRGKKGKRGGSVDTYEDGSGDEDETPLTWEEEFRLLVSDGLTEKRTTTRESALSKIVQILSQHYAEEVLENNRVTLHEALKRSVRREAKESTLASKAFAVLFANLGPGNADLLHDVSPVFKSTIRSSASASAKAESIRALGVGSFVNHTLPEEISEVIDLMRDMLSSKTPNSEILKAALDIIGLLFTALPSNSDVQRAVFDNTMDTYLQLLESKDPEVRIAAGENVALMYELLSDDDQTVDYEHYDELMENLSTLANESTKSKSKKEKSNQKAAFRSIISAVDERDYPSTKLQFGQQTVYIDGFARLRQLNVMREVLGEGMHIHFVDNPLMNELFGVSSDGPTGGKVIRNAAEGKGRSKDRTAERSGKVREIDFGSDYY